MKAVYLILSLCLIAGCSGMAPQDESTGDKEARSSPSTGEEVSTESSMNRNGKEEPAIEQKIGVQQNPKTGDVIVSFVGDVKSCAPIAAGDAAGRGALIVSNDPRYEMVVRVVAAPKGDLLLRPGADVTLGIHSPTLLFGHDIKEAVARRFIFHLHGSLSGGQRRYFHVDAEDVRASKQQSGKAEEAGK